MANSICMTGVHGCSLQSGINDWHKYAKIDNLVMVAKEITDAMEKYCLLWQLVCKPLVCIVAVYDLTSMPIQYMSKIVNLIMVAKEITGCYGKILVAMATSM